MTGSVPAMRLRAGAVAAIAVAGVLVLTGMLGFAGQAQATYPGRNGALHGEPIRGQQVLARHSQLLSDAKTIVVSRRTPTDVFNDKGTGGTLMLVDAAGASERSLPRYMSDDEHRAFMPSGGTIVFDGRASAGAKPSLYTVATGGTGLRRP